MCSLSPFLPRVSDLLSCGWHQFLYLGSIQVVVRERVSPGGDVVAREGGLPQSTPYFQPDLYYLQGIRQRPGFRPVLPWKIVFWPRAKKGLCPDQPRKQVPKWQSRLCLQEFVIPAGDLWGIRARKSMSSSEGPFPRPLPSFQRLRPPAVEAVWGFVGD